MAGTTRRSTAATLLGKLERALGSLTKEKSQRVCEMLADPVPDDVAKAYTVCQRAIENAGARDKAAALAWLEGYVDDLTSGQYEEAVATVVEQEEEVDKEQEQPF